MVCLPEAVLLKNPDELFHQQHSFPLSDSSPAQTVLCSAPVFSSLFTVVFYILTNGFS